MDIANFDLEKELLGQGYGLVLGVDEAGRGPLAGPVVAAAVQLKNFEFRISNFESNPNESIFNDKNWELIRDSKKLSEKQREKAYEFIMENFHVGVGLCDHNTIDRINILEASFLAMKKAIAALRRGSSQSSATSNQQKMIILVDGNKAIPNFSEEQRAVVGGDRKVKAIAAASIIAKVTRDRMMMEAHEKYPEYAFDKHKGYGTKAHMDALEKHGPCEIHRKSFAPVKKNC